MNRIVNSVLRYFDLTSQHSDVAEGLGNQGPKPPWQILLFICVFLGVTSKVIWDHYDEKAGVLAFKGFWWMRLVISLIVTSVIFPGVYKQTLDRSQLPAMTQYCVAFGGGFGYKALMDMGKQ